MSHERSGLPSEARSERLLGLADRWGIPDDFQREEAVAGANAEELAELAHGLDDVHDAFWEWLAGPESYSPEPTHEYVRMTALTMAVDSARLRLARLRPSN